MNEQELLSKMKAPGDHRRGKWLGGIIQVLITSTCDKACFGCTQGSQLEAPRWEMTVDQFRDALRSLKGYSGVIGMFGGNPAMHTQFGELCEVMREEVPYTQRGIWCNNPTSVDKARVMRLTFNPAYSNLNVHLDRRAYEKFKEGWPESRPVGLHEDSRHSPPWVAMRDLVKLPEGKKNVEENRNDLIVGCDINLHWSAGIGVFRGELRAWFCEVAMAQSVRHQHEPGYPDTGLSLWMDPDHGTDMAKSGGIKLPWWTLKMSAYREQVRKHCHECGVPLRGYGALATDESGTEQVSPTHAVIFKSKRGSRAVELVTSPAQLGRNVKLVTDYLGNAKR